VTTPTALHSGWLEDEWSFCESPAGQWADVQALEAASPEDWIPTTVPCTVAKALHRAHRYDAENPHALHTADFWFARTLNAQGEHVLRFDGLATVAEIYLDGCLLHTSTSMYVPVRLPVRLHGSHRLHVVFRSLQRHLQGLKPPRARWRVAMVADQTLRAVRTTLLGHMPSWCPAVDMVGPWRPIALLPATAVEDVRLLTSMEGNDGILTLRLRCATDLTRALVHCANITAPLTPLAQPEFYGAELRIAQVQEWWPNGMGQPVQYDVTLQNAAVTQPLGRVGFRTVEVDRAADGKGFGLCVNGVPMFARGAVFTPVDILHPGSDAGLLERLELLRDMGANLIRIAGPFCYESPSLYAHCANLGLMVWQDLMLANFDYPFSDPDFAAVLEAEVEALLCMAAASPALAVVCGGSEVHQQAAMLGLPASRRKLDFFDVRLVDLVARWAPGTVVVANSPHGGELPFAVREGVSHYFGVGAYERSLDDARRAVPRPVL
jgi:beta-mannosidase